LKKFLSLKKTDTLNTHIYKDIHILLQKFYLMRRMIRSQYEAGSLSISEAQSLFQIFIEKKIIAQRLVQVLQLDKSTVSRIIKGLLKNGFIHTEVSEEDKRVQVLKLTEKGISYVRQTQESSNRILSECLKSLSAREQFELGNLLNILADGLNCTEASYLPGDHPVTLALVRLGRGTGMSGDAFMGTEYSSTQYHIMLLIKEHDTLTFSDLSATLPLNKGTISRSLTYLKKQKLVTTEESKEKKYLLSLLLTTKGEIAINTIDSAGEKIIQEGLYGQPASIPERLCLLLNKLCMPQNIKDEVIIQKKVEIRELSTLQDRQTARGMLIDYLVKNNAHFETPDYLYHPDNALFGLFIDDHVVAACEQVFDNGQSIMINHAQLPQIEDELIKTFHQKLSLLVQK
jgi:DNA-binding MarR family transcriptional regulator